MFPNAAVSEIRETAAMVALLRQGGRKWHQYADLVESVGSAIEVLNGADPLASDEPPPTLFAMPSEASTPVEHDLDTVEDEVRAWEAEGIRVLTVLDADYPANLRTVHNRPPILFVRGELLPEDVRSIAVVGTRQVSRRGLAEAEAVATGLVDRGFTVVSGLADGVDGTAHRAALTRGRRTVAVIGTGVRRTYPAKHAALQQEIAATGAVISQFWPDAPPTRQSFPMRNIVMSGFSLATVVIEASHTSGARMQARFALEHGRPVFLLASLLEHEWAREYAKRPGARVVDDAAEVANLVDRLTAVEHLSA
jgi:DNA processing protein